MANDLMIEITLHGTNEARHGQYVITSRPKTAPVPYLARTLLRNGYTPSTLVTVTRNGTVCFRDDCLGWWADQHIVESDDHGLTRKRYVPFKEYYR
jgi:hypothetical protein